MAMTKVGNVLLSSALKGIRGVLPSVGKELKNVATPLGLGLAAFDVTTGSNSAAGSAGGAVGGSLGSALGSSALSRLGPAGKFTGMLLGGALGYNSGSRLAKKLTPIDYTRKKITVTPEELTYPIGQYNQPTPSNYFTNGEQRPNIL